MKSWESVECPNVWKIIDLLLAPVDEGLHEIGLLILRSEPVIVGLMDMDMVHMGVVVLGSNWIGIWVVLYMVHMVVGVVDKD